MQNENNQSPQPPKGEGQQGYYGWQYDQEHPEGPQQGPAPNMRPYQPPPPTSYGPPPGPGPAGRSSPLPPRYQEPVADMGTTLGYGQGMEYQYFDPPQPSQPFAQLRQERLQQLREERMRRQQRRMGDLTNFIPWKSSKSVPPSPLPPTRTSGNLDAPRPVRSGDRQYPEQMSPVIARSGPLPNELSPIRSSTVAPRDMHAMPERPSGQMRAASAPAQDTGMIQRVRIGRAAMILTGAFIASRILGLLRTSMFAYVFGTSNISDAYLQAFLIPELIFNIVAGGALSSAFIPVFVAEKGEKSAWRLASSALNLAIGVMIVLALVAIILAPALVPLYNPNASPQQLALITSLTRIMLLQSIALGGGVIITSVLNAKQDFMLPAIGTVLYNVGIILGLMPGLFLALSNQRNDIFSVYCVTWGVVIGAIFQVAIQIPGLFKLKMHYSFSFDWRNPSIIQIGRQMVPRIVNAAMLYFSIFVDRGLIGLLAVVAGPHGTDGLITQYTQALQLVLLPLSIFGMSMSTAAFPTLAENVTKGRLDRVRNTILETLRSILFMSIPSSIGLLVLGLPIIQVLFEHGRFSLSDAQATVIPLGGFAIGLVGLAAVEILTRSFYAFRDSRTPVIISIGQFLFKIMLSLVLIDLAYFWGAQWGMGVLAFSTSVASLLEAGILLWLLQQQYVKDMQFRTLALFVGRVLLASLAMGVCVFALRGLLDIILVTTKSSSLGLGGTILAMIKLALEVFVGLFVYIRVARRLGIEELGPVKRVLDRLKLSWI